MTLIDRTERQTSEDVVVQGGGRIIKGLFGWALVLSAVGVWGPFAPCIRHVYVGDQIRRFHPFADCGILIAACAQGLTHLIMQICPKDVIYLAVFNKFQFTQS